MLLPLRSAITPATPTAADFSFTPTSVPYDGNPHSVTVSVAAGITGMGAVTATNYNGSPTAPTAAGSYAITINVAAGSNYTAASNLALGNLAIGVADQTITFGAAPAVNVASTGAVTATTTATPAANYPIGFTTTSANCTVTSAGVVTGVHAGSCLITASQPGDAYYHSATATQTLTIGKGSQTITFGAAPAVHVAGSGTVSAITTAAAPATPATYAISYSTTSTGCAVDAITGVVTGIHAGTNNCVITATQAGDADFNGATATQTLSISQDPSPIVTLTATPNPATVGQNVTLTATVAGDPPTGTVTFCAGITTPDASCTGGTTLCSVVPLTIHPVNSTASCNTTFNSTGTQEITALYSGDADYAEAITGAALSVGVLPPGNNDAVGIPTLSQWGLALLAVMMGVAAARTGRRRR